jgi:hypothetical protein
MANRRRLHSATLLANGKVLAAGGFDEYGSPLQAELYDPAAGTWSAAGAPIVARNAHTATLLANGKVLVAGGRNTADGTGTTYLTRVEVFDPATSSWSLTTALTATRAHHTATLLPNGKVLLAGGMNGSGYLTGCVLYDPVPGTWAATGGFAAPRAHHTATLLPEGKVLVTGGNNSVSYLTATELYDPATGTWSASGAMATARRGHTATLLPDGKVLLAGGASGTTTYAPAAEFYDPASGTCSAGPTLTEGKEWHAATLLATGEVLLAGGGRSTNIFYSTAELYDTPTLTTPASSLITGTTVRLGGNVTLIGSAAVTGRGVVFAPANINNDPKLGGPGVVSMTTTGTTGTFTVNVTDLTPGTIYRFRAYATNAVGTGYTAASSFTTLTALEMWRKTWYGTTADVGNAADDADPHHTGISNLLVFAFLGPAQNPAQARRSQLPQAGWTGGSYGYAFMPPAGTGALNYSAEHSTTLAEGSWLQLPDTGESGIRRFVLPADGLATGFLRLKVTRP